MASESRIPVNVRVTPTSKEWLDEVARHHRVDRSDVIRAALAMAHAEGKQLAALIEQRR